MTDRTVVLALTPSLGGDFFGEILAGITREVVAAGARVIVVETLQEFSPRDEAGTPGDFDTPLAWSLADGVISLTTAVGPTYLSQLTEADTPVVLLSSTQMEDVAAPEVRPDNHHGAVAAVSHLIDHGHTRIGFVGNLAQLDIRERYQAFQDTLAARGLTHDLDLLFAAPENAETGGATAARAVLTASELPTALMAATDRNAIGLINALTQAGLSVPADVAVASFDNIASGAYCSPPLTTVDPQFSEVGAAAARTLLAQISGTAPASPSHARASLVIRGSCGCAGNDAVATVAPPFTTEPGDDAPPTSGDDAPPTSGDTLAAALTRVLERDLLTGIAGADQASMQTIGVIVALSEGIIEAGESATEEQIAEAMSHLRTVTSRPDTVRRVADAMMTAARARALRDPAPPSSPDTSLDRLAAALWKAQAAAFLTHAEMTDDAIAEQYIVDAGLLSTHGGDPRSLGWLAGTRVRAAALALWDDVPGGSVTIAGQYHIADADLGLVGATMACEGFPPTDLVSIARAESKEVCVIVPVKTKDHDWGLLALVGELDPTTIRESYQHWAALLCAALESQRRLEEVERVALFDTLTGLPNRSLFMQQVDKALSRWRRDGTPFSVLFMDLDEFKLINDTLGHHMGDQVLQSVAEIIRRELRTMDTAARFGGDEFVLLLADTNPSRAVVAARRLQAELNEPLDLNGHQLLTRASIGIASSEVEYGSADEVLRDADAAMYQAKSVEHGSIAYFDAPMHAEAQRRAHVGRELLHGLAQQQFEVLYQPLVDLATGSVRSVEALVRWHHPDRGVLGPEDFFGDIEESAPMVELGRWVVDQVCAQLAQWHPHVDHASINVSDKEFWSPGLVTTVTEAIKRHGLEPAAVTVEITESMLTFRTAMALRIMRALDEAGVGLVIDDFGTGSGSIETLQRIPTHAFKIDRRYVERVSERDNASDLMTSLVNLGVALGREVLVSGVDTPAHARFVQELGCVAAQGEAFSPPVPGHQVLDLVARLSSAGH